MLWSSCIFGLALASKRSTRATAHQVRPALWSKAYRSLTQMEAIGSMTGVIARDFNNLLPLLSNGLENLPVDNQKALSVKRWKACAVLPNAGQL